MHLNRLDRLGHGHLRSIELGHTGSKVVVFTAVLQGGGFHHHQAGGFNLCSHIGQFECDGLVLVDGFAKCLPLFGVGQREFVCPGGDAQGLGRDADASACQGLHGKFESKPVFTDAVFLGHFYVLEHQRVRIRSSDAHLVFLGSNDETGHVALHNQGIDATVALVSIGLCDDEVGAGASAVGDPVFGAVQQVVIAAINGGCRLGCGIRTCFGFAEAKCSNLLAGCQGAKVFFLLLLGSEGL